jgi:hypothetical protein
MPFWVVFEQKSEWYDPDPHQIFRFDPEPDPDPQYWF